MMKKESLKEVLQRVLKTDADLEFLRKLNTTKVETLIRTKKSKDKSDNPLEGIRATDNRRY